MRLSVVLLCIASSLALAAGPSRPPWPRFTIGKDTTFFTGPRDEQGYIDYSEAINRYMSRGLKANDNAAVFLWRATGPAPEGTLVPHEHFTAIGMKRPPEKGDYLIASGKFATERLKLKGAKLEAFNEEQSRAIARPWKAKGLPQIAAWLKANEKPLALAHEAVKRDRYFTALVVTTKNGKKGDLMGALLPSVQKCREVAYALAARAMLRVGEGKTDAAWRDLLACHRLGRLVQQGNTLVEALVGYAVENVACQATLAFLDKTKPDAKRLARYAADLRKLPPPADLAEKIDVVERAMLLDCAQMMDRNGLGYLEALADAPGRKPWPLEKLLMWLVFDYASIMRDSNRWYDRIVQSMRKPTRAERQAAFASIDNELKALRAEALAPPKGGVLGALRGASKRIGQILIALLLPAAGKVQDAGDRLGQTHDNVRLAIALEMHHRDNKAYPQSLSKLSQKYLPRVPGDRFSGNPLIYKQAGKGYLLYSIGPNSKDEGGKGPGEGGDDLVVRMTLPALKKK